MAQYLIVGLGNPGEEYAETRHNAGFRTVDILADEMRARYWKNECGALTAKGVYRDHDIVLAKPQSFMNVSGGPVKKLCDAYGIEPRLRQIAERRANGHKREHGVCRCTRFWLFACSVSVLHSPMIPLTMPKGTGQMSRTFLVDFH